MQISRESSSVDPSRRTEDFPECWKISKKPKNKITNSANCETLQKCIEIRSATNLCTDVSIHT